MNDNRVMLFPTTPMMRIRILKAAIIIVSGTNSSDDAVELPLFTAVEFTIPRASGE